MKLTETGQATVRSTSIVRAGTDFPIFGARAVIGAGSVVTPDIPEGVCAAGNPCRAIREITAEDG